VLEYYDALDAASGADIALVLHKYTRDDYLWRGVHPFHERSGADAVADAFWTPFRRSFAPVQRRPDVFIAGYNTTTSMVATQSGSARWAT